jgi:isopenicillin-N N-acyltransferase like protein
MGFKGMAKRGHRLVILILVSIVAVSSAIAAEPFRWPEAKHGAGELRYINHVPVLVLAGTPEEMGEQVGVLCKSGLKDAEKLLMGYVEAKHMGKVFPVLLKTAGALSATFPPDHLKEMKAVAKSADMSPDLIIAAHALHDMLQLRGCSDVIVEPARSTTGGLLFGRNTDLPPVAGLQDFWMVIVFRPKGKRAFAAVSVPGGVGVGAAMNDAGLCMGQNEILQSGDDSPKYNPLGTPIFLGARRLMEECKDLDEAEKLIREMNWTTATLFAMADRKEGRIFEVTPKSVHVRKANSAFCAATNHFRTKGLSVSRAPQCWRWPRLETASQANRPFGVKEVQDTLDSVNQGNYTLQSMVFEPGPMRAHVALGEPPVTKLPYREIDLRPLLNP